MNNYLGLCFYMELFIVQRPSGPRGGSLRDMLHLRQPSGPNTMEETFGIFYQRRRETFGLYRSGNLRDLIPWRRPSGSTSRTTPTTSTSSEACTTTTHLFGSVRNYPLKQTYVHSIGLHLSWCLLRKSYWHLDFRVLSLAYLANGVFFGSSGVSTLGSTASSPTHIELAVSFGLRCSTTAP